MRPEPVIRGALMAGLLAAVLALAALAGPAAAQQIRRSLGSPEAAERLVLRSTTDIAVFGPVLEAFLETAPDIAIDYEQWLTNELYDATAADCTRWRHRAQQGAQHGGAAPVAASAVISSGAHQMVDLVNAGCADRYTTEEARALPQALVWRNELWGITREPAVMVYNRDLVPPAEIPHTRFDLLDLLRPERSRYAGRVATYDIEASGLGYLFAFADSEQASTYGALLESFGRTGAVATCCSSEIIDGVASGRYLVAYNVLGSYARARALRDPRIGVVAPRDYTLVLSRAFMIPKGAPAPAAARRLLDFLLSPAGQLALSRQSLVVSSSDMPDGDTADVAAESQLRPIGLRPPLLVALDRQTRARFIARWRETFPPPP